MSPESIRLTPGSATAVPDSAAISAMKPTTIAGDGRRAKNRSIRYGPSFRWLRARGGLVDPPSRSPRSQLKVTFGEVRDREPISADTTELGPDAAHQSGVLRHRPLPQPHGFERLCARFGLKRQSRTRSAT